MNDKLAIYLAFSNFQVIQMTNFISFVKEKLANKQKCIIHVSKFIKTPKFFHWILFLEKNFTHCVSNYETTNHHHRIIHDSKPDIHDSPNY